ncbi:MAG: divalent-cation tolerance protein CutA [Planctomycetota bacterium]
MTSDRQPDDPRVVLVTAPDEVVARRLADGLVSGGLCACVNLVPGVTSVYRWDGVVQADSEVLMVAKTVAERVPEIESFLAREHPYDVPECVALEVASVEAAYLAWLRRSVARG